MSSPYECLLNGSGIVELCLFLCLLTLCVCLSVLTGSIMRTTILLMLVTAMMMMTAAAASVVVAVAAVISRPVPDVDLRSGDGQRVPLGSGII